MGSSCSSGIKFHLCKMNSSSKLLHKRAYAAAKSLQSCPILCDPIDGSPPGFPSLGFSRQEHWSGLPFPTPGHLPDPGTEPEFLAAPSLEGGFFTTSTTWEAHISTTVKSVIIVI